MPMDYTDFADMMKQSGGGGGGGKLYRPQNFIGVGNTPMAQAASYNISDIYRAGGTKVGAPLNAQAVGTPLIPQMTPPKAEGLVTTTDYPGLDQSLAESGEWYKWTNPQGVDQWMPAEPELGMMYQDMNGSWWRWTGDDWKAATTQYSWTDFENALLDFGSGNVNDLWDFWAFHHQNNDEYARTIPDNFEEFVRKVVTNPDWFSSVVNQMPPYYQKATGSIVSGAPWAAVEDIAILAEAYGLASSEDIINAMVNGDQEFLDNLAMDLEEKAAASTEGDVIDLTGEWAGGVSWVDDLQRIGQDFSDGNLDFEAMAQSDNPVERWFADVIGESYNTGLIAGPVVDEEGNINPQVEQWVASYDPELEEQHEQYMKDLRLAALKRNQSSQDVVYNEALANYQTEAAMQVAQQVSGRLMNEMESSFRFIQNAITDALQMAGDQAAAAAFNESMDLEWDRAYQEYQQQLDMLAQEVAATKYRSNANFITGIAGFITSIFGAIL